MDTLDETVAFIIREPWVVRCWPNALYIYCIQYEEHWQTSLRLALECSVDSYTQAVPDHGKPICPLPSRCVDEHSRHPGVHLRGVWDENEHRVHRTELTALILELDLLELERIKRSVTVDDGCSSKQRLLSWILCWKWRAGDPYNVLVRFRVRRSLRGWVDSPFMKMLGLGESRQRTVAADMKNWTEYLL